MKLTEFLLARITEERERANAAKRAMQGEWFTGAADDVERFVHALTPDRVLAECKAKRQIVAEWSAADSVADAEHDAGFTWESAEFSARAEGLKGALRALAAIYADHPDFDPEWRV